MKRGEKEMRALIIHIIIITILLVCSCSLFAISDLEIAQEIAKTFDTEIIKIQGIHTIAVLPIKGDKEGLITYKIKEELLTNKIFKVIEIETNPEENLKENNKDKDTQALETLREQANKKNVDALLIGEIKKEYIEGRERNIILGIQILNVKNSEILYNTTKEFTYRLNTAQFKDNKQKTLLIISGLCVIGIILVRRLGF